ncbi:acyl-CoA-dehydrogenase protein [Chloropicon primus]|uniref:Acyl-CoA-dehydrogenase protein n=1 Tax=Chloropicon primus TaxID=1764295 RepID=A0A5B8MZD0_9CHLO|nr:acyl-CoA-dehydrogenase protein [Chloropicon primus]UPR04110.1 acyl-CoA-dehydrogenase protein [Chloropicon primus]|eukprot:QDZ24900.1 acyl-CoA-dehydrogenase protein [Chloropicon primus]
MADKDRTHQPWISHAWLGDAYLRDTVDRYFSKRARRGRGRSRKGYTDALRELESWGWRCVTEVHELGREAGQRESEPRLVAAARKRDLAWSKVSQDNEEHARVNLWTSEAWKKLHAIAAEEGLVAAAFERENYGELSRVFQFSKLYMFNASSGLYSCPLAMTDGAARLCELLGREDMVYRRAFGNLVSRDPLRFWTSGQWMTEIQGGSDVASGVETVAKPLDEGGEVGAWANARLFGYKWFSSATDARMAFTLARDIGEDGEMVKGTRGLSLFYVEVRDEQGRVRTDGIRLRRLKDKLGTRQLPTAELELVGVPCRRIGKRGRGVAQISALMNITRLHNSITAASYIRRIACITLDYAKKRAVFGKLLVDQPLAIQTLAHFEVHAQASLAMTMEAVYLLGLSESGRAMEDEKAMLRILTPLCKLYTAKQVVWSASECLEFFGGQGYIESTGIPEIFRDSLVLPIWEGPTNVLCLDVLRAMLADSGRGATALLSRSTRALLSGKQGAPPGQDLHKSIATVTKMAHDAKRQVSSLVQAFGDKGKAREAERDEHLGQLKRLVFSLCKILVSSLLVEHSSRSLPSSHSSSSLGDAVASAYCKSAASSPESSVDLGHLDFSSARAIVAASSSLSAPPPLQSKF